MHPAQKEEQKGSQEAGQLSDEEEESKVSDNDEQHENFSKPALQAPVEESKDQPKIQNIPEEELVFPQLYETARQAKVENEYQQAIELLLTALEDMNGMTPQQRGDRVKSLIHCEIADCYLRLNDYQQMLQTAQEAKQVDSGCIRAYMNEAIALTELGKEEQGSYEQLTAGIETLKQAILIQGQYEQADPEQLEALERMLGFAKKIMSLRELEEQAEKDVSSIDTLRKRINSLKKLQIIMKKKNTFAENKKMLIRISELCQ